MKYLMGLILLLAAFSGSAYADQADDLTTFRFIPGQIGPDETTFTIESSSVVPTALGPVFTVSINGSPWTFALDEPSDTYVEEAFYTMWFGPGAIPPDQVGYGSVQIPWRCDIGGPYEFDGCLDAQLPQPWDGHWIPGTYNGYTITAGIPEPSTVSMVALGALILLLRRKY